MTPALPIKSGCRRPRSLCHRTAFLHDTVTDPRTGTVHRTSTGAGHAQGRKLDLKYVTA